MCSSISSVNGSRLFSTDNLAFVVDSSFIDKELFSSLENVATKFSVMVLDSKLLLGKC